MDTKEIWQSITSKPKWYAGIKNRNGNYYTAQSANRLKNLFKKGKLNQTFIEYIFSHFGYYKEETKWLKK